MFTKILILDVLQSFEHISAENTLFYYYYDAIGVVLVSLLLIVNIFHTLF